MHHYLDIILTVVIVSGCVAMQIFFNLQAKKQKNIASPDTARPEGSIQREWESEIDRSARKHAPTLRSLGVYQDARNVLFPIIPLAFESATLRGKIPTKELVREPEPQIARLRAAYSLDGSARVTLRITDNGAIYLIERRATMFQIQKRRGQPPRRQRVGDIQLPSISKPLTDRLEDKMLDEILQLSLNELAAQSQPTPPVVLATKSTAPVEVTTIPTPTSPKVVPISAYPKLTKGTLVKSGLVRRISTSTEVDSQGHAVSRSYDQFQIVIKKLDGEEETIGGAGMLEAFSLVAPKPGDNLLVRELPPQPTKRGNKRIFELEII